MQRDDNAVYENYEGVNVENQCARQQPDRKGLSSSKKACIGIALFYFVASSVLGIYAFIRVVSLSDTSVHDRQIDQGIDLSNVSTPEPLQDLPNLNTDTTSNVPNLRWVPVGNGYQYYLGTQLGNYSESRKFCKSIGADLAAVGVRNVEYRRIITKTVIQDKVGNRSAWIGMNDIASEGNWVWIDNRKVIAGESDWAEFQPDNGGGIVHRQNCGIMASYFQMHWDDVSCDEAVFALCEKS
uniref:galactose-specific lectin nattectin-like isoform X2 n=1 Tax=Ciona intestinalis TaxID=7719 RepID=UPI0002B8E750|nr:galactose-specific lectin nattectin-like isoform X2 [Ciona intestinalis]|eukprot:XP_026691220.1 galactose-specific lectin nattectin-like isoform X2 [Ciona intestinalis]